MSAIDRAAKQAKEAIENMADIKCSKIVYLAALEDVQCFLEIGIEATQEDLKREEES